MTRRTYASAVADQETARAIADRGGRPYPDRITQSLDAPANGGPPLEGPEVDLACDAVEPAVDRWETGEEVPTLHQLQLLADLTGYPVGFYFREPVKLEGTGFLCVRSGPGKGCYPLSRDGEVEPAQEKRLARALAPRPEPKPPAPKPDPPPPGPLPECSGCGGPMRRPVWVRRHGRCSQCGPA